MAALVANRTRDSHRTNPWPNLFQLLAPCQRNIGGEANPTHPPSTPQFPLQRCTEETLTQLRYV